MLEWFSFDNPAIGLYEICFPSEFTDELVKDLCEYLHLPFDLHRLRSKQENDGTPGLQSLYIEGDNRTRSLLMVDCSNNDWIYTVVIAYDETIHPPIHQRLCQWDCFCREQYGQPRPEGYRLRNKLSDTRSLFKQMIMRHRLMG